VENIRQAVERAKAYSDRQSTRPRAESPPRREIVSARQFAGKRQIELDRGHLQSHRIIAYDGQDPRSRPFDVLRSDVLRSMDAKNWKTVAVTSPSPSCGKTFTAINLALSMARQVERKVRLVDLDVRKPRVAASLGLDCREGLVDVLEGRSDLESVVVDVSVGNIKLEILPTTASKNASDLITSTEMTAVLQNLAVCQESQIVIFDLPPLLTGHDVMSILPQVDCALLVAAAGASRISEVEECYRVMHETNVVRVILNKAPASPSHYAYY
jgi:protein-tyrosine kinase